MALVTVSEGNGGDFLPIVKYDSRAGRIFRVDRDQNGSTPVDITRAFKALFDFEQVEVGYILFSAGGAPDFKMVPYGATLPPRPAGDYKQGIRMRIKLAPACGGDVREMAGTAGAFLRGINAVHDEYLTLAPANPGKLPIIVLADTIAVESGGGQKRSTNYQPQWSIEGWAPRPADMPLAGMATNGVTQPAVPASARNGVAQQVPPPAVSANAVNRASNMDDFG